MKLSQAKKYYKKSQNDGLENVNPFEIFKKIQIKLVIYNMSLLPREFQ